MPRHRVTLRLLAVLAATVLLASACSDEDEPTDAGESAADDAGADGAGEDGGSADEDAADGSSADEDGADQDGPDQDAADEGAAVDPDIEVPAEAEAYCARSFEAAQREGLGFAPTPEEVEAYYTALLDDLEYLAANAPAEIADAVGRVAGVFDEVVTIVADADYDMEVAGPELDEFGSDPDREALMDDAIGELEAFDRDVCGIEY